MRAAVADQAEAAPPRAARRRRAPPLGRTPQERCPLTQGAAGGRERARPPSGDCLPAPGLGPAACSEEGRGRDTGTRIFRPSKRQAARQGVGPRPCALARRRPRPQELSQGATKQSSGNLTYIRRAKRHYAPRLLVKAGDGFASRSGAQLAADNCDAKRHQAAARPTRVVSPQAPGDRARRVPRHIAASIGDRPPA